VRPIVGDVPASVDCGERRTRPESVMMPMGKATATEAMERKMAAKRILMFALSSERIKNRE